MTSKRPKYVREERNGKIVYVPRSNQPNVSKPSDRRRNIFSGNSTGMIDVTGQLFFSIGDICIRWFPAIAITGAAGLTLGLGWLGWQAITNPDMIYWVNQLTPGNLNRKIPAEDQPKTLDQVLSQIKRNGKVTGDPIVLRADFSFSENLDRATAIAVPILAQREDSACPNRCDAIEAIQVYRALELPGLIQIFQRQRRFRKASQVRINGPSEEDLNRLVRSLTRSGSNEGNSSSMGMTVIKVKNTQDGNRWLLLSGLMSKGSARASFGQILLVNSKRTQLNVMANWLSPSGKSPIWKDVTGDGQTDIVIEQSIELEPSFKVYEHKNAPNGEQWVRSLNLSKAAIPSAPYQNALKLAKSGLWKQAKTQLETLKSNGVPWSDQAQAQLELIKLHTQVLEEDNNLAFSDPVAEIQSLLIRGEWQLAQAKILTSRTVFDGVDVILESDNGQIGDRIHIAALVGPNRKDAVEWGIIYHYARGGKGQAQSWVKKNHPDFSDRLEPLLKKLSYPKKEKTDSPTSESTKPKQS